MDASSFTLIATAAALAVTGGALAMLAWSWRHGQLRALDRGATSIFDDREPVGRMTDRFPRTKADRGAAGRR